MAPAYTVAEETYKYRPKSSSSEKAVWKVDQGPKGLAVEDDGATIVWKATSDQKGTHSVTLSTKVGGHELTQTGEITVAVAEERAAVDADALSGGQVVVTAPKSRVAGASIQANPGSLKEATRLSISEVDSSPEMGIAKGGSRAVQFGPSGTVFSDPATIALPLSDEPVTKKERVGAFVYDPKGRWERVEVVSVDTDKGIVHAKAKHFSLYAAAETTLGLTLAAATAPESGACAGDLFVSASVDEPLSQIAAKQVANLSEKLMAQAGERDLGALLGDEGLQGSFRFVRVVELGQSQGGDRVMLESRLLVSTLHLAGDGSARVTHSDALGNVLGSFDFPSARDSVSDLWLHLSGRAVRAVFEQAPSENLSLTARMHVLYFEGDASLDPVSADDLGFALIDMDAVAFAKATADARDADLDCDGLVKAFDAMDDRLLPRIVTKPQGVIAAVAGHPVRLNATLLNAPANTSVDFRVIDGSASLSAVAEDASARDFLAQQAGRFLVDVRAEVEGETLSSTFAIDVSPEVQLPKCTPSPDRSTLKEGESVALSAVLGDNSIPATSLEVKWGALADGALVALSDLDARGYSARFAPRSAGRYALACKVVQGGREGALGSTSLDVVPAQNNLPPTDLTLSPSYETILVGSSLTFAAQAKDPEGGALTFSFGASGGTLGTAQTSGNASRVSFSAGSPALYEVKVEAKDSAGAAQSASAYVLVVAKMADTDGADADKDGWPSGLDCNDQDPKINPGMVDRCGDAIDDDCSGTAANTDCDSDGFSVEQGDCNDQNRAINPRAAERCDGIDNNCNGQRDEGFSVGATCSVGVGQCQRSATWVCSADGFGTVCPAAPLRPQPEVCDGIDNDCDGALDEDLPRRDVTCGVGACAAKGVSSCVAGKEQSSCVPLPAAPSDATCDGVDNDCDGAVDDDFVKLAEVCNGKDDNCDRRIDEGLMCQGGSTATCKPSGAEVCNGLDDDCNGRFDENNVCGVTNQVGSLVGVYWDCKDASCSTLGSGGIMFLADSSGIKLNSFNQGDYDPIAGPYCVERPISYSVAGDQLTLNWIDDASVPHTAQGTFAISGAHLSVNFTTGPADMLGKHELVRVQEQAGGHCPVGPVCAQQEACGNGFDDNCNGLDDQHDPACVKCTGPAAPEVCDQLDNDCNGAVDDLKQPCTRDDALGACRMGHMACPAQGTTPVCNAGSPDPQGELCADGVDNDCDGATDENGCTPLTPGETCFNPIDVSAGGVFSFDKGTRSDAPGGCRPDNYVDRVFFLQTPTGMNNQYVVTVDSADKIDVGATLYKAPLGYTPGTACPSMANTPMYCFGGGAGRGGTANMQMYLDPASLYMLVVKSAPDSMIKGGAFRLSVARSNDGICTPADGDGDGKTICMGDCNDAAQTTYPGAAELCNQIDDDCDGLIDEQDGTCQTGLPGACALGQPQCNQNPACQPLQQSARDYCGDGVDNDCNGAVDDNCLAAAGESCDNAIDMGLGGAFSGTLVGASDDALSRCGMAGPERFYRFTVPVQGANVSLREAGYRGAISYTLYNDCGLTGAICGFKSAYLPQGTYRLAVETNSASSAQGYAFTFAMSDSKNCLTPDMDGDGANACAGDCDESQPAVHSGAPEGGACDNIDNDCNGMVDDISATCSVPGQLGVCATGALRCDPKGGTSNCAQVVFPDARGRDVCGDGLDNDCDGAADGQDPQLCVTLPPGDVCGSAQLVDLSAGGRFAHTLEGYGDDVKLGCGDDAGSAIERFYSVTLAETRVLHAELRWNSAQGDTGYMGLALVNGCTASGATGGVQCASSFFSQELPAGTYTLAVFGPPSRVYDLLVWTQLSADSTGVSCVPADLDADGVTMCTGDCREGDANVHPGVREVCDNVDNDCNGAVDENIQTTQCTVPAAQGDCAMGMNTCQQGTFICLGPKPMAEICGDSRDNDCDGMADDTGTPGVDCVVGETCADALPIGLGYFDGTLNGARNDGNGCYGGSQGLAPERYYAFNAPQAGHYYVALQPKGPGPFPPFAYGFYEGACAPTMTNDGCANAVGSVIDFYLNSAGLHYLVVESDGVFDYRIGIATMDAAGKCSMPDNDADGVDLCHGECNDQNSSVRPGAPELCNGVDDNCNGQIDESC